MKIVGEDHKRTYEVAFCDEAAFQKYIEILKGKKQTVRIQCPIKPAPIKPSLADPEFRSHQPMNKKKTASACSDVRELMVKLIDISKLQEKSYLTKIVDEWKRTAEFLQRLARQRNQLMEADQFESAANTAQGFIRELSSLYDAEKIYFACQSPENNILGLILLSKEPIHPMFQKEPIVQVDLLLTSPSHIHTSMTDSATRVSGIGRILMSHAEKIAKERGAEGVMLIPETSAIGFFERLGYINKEKDVWCKRV